MSDSSDIVVAYANYKDAALYFDYVIPIIEGPIQNLIAGLTEYYLQHRDFTGIDKKEAIARVTGEISETPASLFP